MRGSNQAEAPPKSVLHPARGKDFLDWETINKPCEQNGDFAKFVEDVKIDFESKRIHKAEYDEIPKDPEKSIAEKPGIVRQIKIRQASRPIDFLEC